MTLRPTERVSYKVARATPRYSTPGRNYYSAGGVGTLAGKGLVFATTWLRTALHAVTVSDICFWRGSPREITGYMPNCGSAGVVEPGNLWNQVTTVDRRVEPEPSFRMYYYAWRPYRSGFSQPGLRYGHSEIVESASVVDDIGSLALWMSY